MGQLPTDSRRTKPLILIAAEIHSFRLEVARCLEKVGWEVLQASTSKAAIALCALHCFDVVVLDHSILDLLGQIRKQLTPIIVLVNKDQIQIEDNLLGSEVDLLLEKPVKPSTLLACITKASCSRIEKLRYPI
ncbi:response regulator [Albidovulum aquaemixtae]|uniref:response regulator n=1 Tax=Albidovulum aquaemixtae TaxID=1542388 RepID=UPI000D55A8F4